MHAKNAKTIHWTNKHLFKTQNLNNKYSSNYLPGHTLLVQLIERISASPTDSPSYSTNVKNTGLINSKQYTLGALIGQLVDPPLILFSTIIPNCLLCFHTQLFISCLTY